MYGGIAARLLKIPVRVSSISGLGYVFISSGVGSRFLKFLISILYRIALKGSKAVIFQNITDSEKFLKLGAIIPEQMVLIRGSGVNLKSYIVKKEPDENLVVMFVARLLIDKGISEFVAAAQLLKPIQPEIRMVLVGDIDPDNRKSITHEQLNLWVDSGLIEYWGYSKNIPETMSKANIIVLPSYREGLPKSLIEAAACGRSVITTNVPGCRDAIEHNKTGLLVPAKTVRPLADAIFKLINNIDLRHEFAVNGRKLAEESFDIECVIKKHLDIYEFENCR